jgi:predicted PurR-regulated permease PerM
MQNSTLRKVSFFIFLVFTAIIFIKELAMFIPAFLGALTLYSLLKQPLQWIIKKYKINVTLAVLLLLLATVVVIVLPFLFSFQLLYNKLGTAVNNYNTVLVAADNLLTKIEEKYKIEILSQENITNVTTSLTSLLSKTLGATINAIIGIVLMYFILYFMLKNSKSVDIWVYKNLPLHRENKKLLMQELDVLIKSNAIGIPLTALLQAVIALIAYTIIGINDVGFWFVITFIAAMIPFGGAALAYVPIAILLFNNGMHTKAIFLLLFGFLIVGSADNVFRFLLQKKMGNMHPVITVLGVIIGLNLFGFMGLIFGPIMVALFVLLYKVYKKEFFNIHFK